MKKTRRAPVQRRSGTIARIHCLKRDLALDDDTYRDLLQQLTGKRSSAELTEGELLRVATTMQSRAGQPTVDIEGRPHNLDEKPELTKIEALLAESKLSWAYANGIANRMYRIKYVAWLDPVQLRGVITALVNRDRKQKAKEAKS